MFCGGGKEFEGFLEVHLDAVTMQVAKSEKRLGDATARFGIPMHFVDVCGHKVFSVWGVDAVGGFEDGLDVGGDGFQARQGFLYFGAEGAEAVHH